MSLKSAHLRLILLHVVLHDSLMIGQWRLRMLLAMKQELSFAYVPQTVQPAW